MFIHEVFKVSWSTIFKVTPLFILLLVSVLFISPQEVQYKPKGWRESFIRPYQNLFKTYQFALISVVLFIIAYKMNDRFVAPMDQFFLRDTLGPAGFYVIKLISTFALSFSAIKSGPLLARFGYKGTLSISILAGMSTISCYYLCSLKSYPLQLLCIMLTAVLFGLFYYLVKGQKRQAGLAILAAGVVVILRLAGIIGNTGMIAVYSTVIIAKMTAGIRNSALYSYQTALCSKEYALTQVALLMGLEKLSALALQSSSGFVLTKFGWSIFYFIAFALSILPLAFRNLTKYPVYTKKG